jgi:hypothetical protein
MRQYFSTYILEAVINGYLQKLFLGSCHLREMVIYVLE